jgi:hypothetical protein
LPLRGVFPLCVFGRPVRTTASLTTTIRAANIFRTDRIATAYMLQRRLLESNPNTVFTPI